MSWDAVILAAGRGRRMGGPKALLDLGGATLLELQLRALRGAAQIAVVVEGTPRIGAWTPLPQKGRMYVANPRAEEGPFVSIQLGLEALGGDRPVLIVPVDCPAPPGAPALLLRTATPGFAWVAPTRDGRRGHPVLLTAAGRNAARNAGLGMTLRDLLAATPGAEVPVDSPLVHCNLNTPSDRDRFLADHPCWPDLHPGDAP
ncbi:MAG: NTP transferase domain-containing protein [Pseudomonadota bacterium]